MADAPQGQNDWLKYSRLDERTLPLLRRRGAIGRGVFSIVLILAGILLFLSNLGFISAQDLWRYWPVFPIAAGIGRLFHCATPAKRAWAFFLIACGSFFLLLTLGLVHLKTKDDSWPFSLMMIAAGCLMLYSVLTAPDRPAGEKTHPFFSFLPTLSWNEGLSDLVVLGALKRKVDSIAFQGGSIMALLGNVELDLRHSAIDPGLPAAVLHVQSIFAAAKIRVPQNWRVHLNGASILGNFEDKTIPPNTGSEAPVLVITGYSLFSSVEIED